MEVGSWLTGCDYCSPLGVYAVITNFLPLPGSRDPLRVAVGI